MIRSASGGLGKMAGKYLNDAVDVHHKIQSEELPLNQHILETINN